MMTIEEKISEEVNRIILNNKGNNFSKIRLTLLGMVDISRNDKCTNGYCLYPKYISLTEESIQVLNHSEEVEKTQEKERLLNTLKTIQ